MRFSDLKTYFSHKFLEFEIRLDSVDRLCIDDFIDIVSSDTVYVRKSGEAESKYISGIFATQKYKNEFNDHSHGKYFCQIHNIIGNVIDVLMIYDLQVEYESAINKNGINIATLDEALKGTSVDGLNQMLGLEYTLKAGTEDYYLLGKYSDSKKTNSFILVDARRGKYLPVVARKFSEIDLNAGNSTESAYVLDSSEKNLNHFERYSFFLYDGKIQLEDKSKIHRLSELTKAFISSGGNEYINQWRIYTEKQMELEQKAHDEAGMLHFDKIVCEKTGYYHFKIKNTAAIQPFLKKARKENGNINVKIIQYNRNGYSFENKAVMTDKLPSGLDYVECRFDDDETAENFKITLPGMIEVDLTGAAAVFQRRIQAFDAIQKGEAANDALPYILDGRTVNTYSKKDLNDSIKLDDRIIRKHFKHNPPNPNQLRAIEIALQTPDIAIIQGPPGTGKTKVIKTIEEHLQSKQKNVTADKDKYLLTAYQRDATKNMAEGVDAEYDLPIVSYYGGDAAASKADYRIKQWCEEKVKYLEDNNINLQYFSDKKQDIVFVSEIRDTLHRRCSADSAIRLLNQAIDCAESFIDRDNRYMASAENNNTENLTAAINQVKKLNRKLERRVKSERLPELLFYAKIIPTSQQEMDDEGIALVEKICQKLSCIDYEASFKAAIDSLRFSATTCDFAELRRVKTELILLISNINYLYSDERSEAEDALDMLSDAMKQHRYSEKQEIISEYLYSLYPGTELLETVAKYQQIVAATHQLSRKASHEYKDVLIDEAARSCPADMMIPLAEAKNRIVLVGDHKQLPQYIEDDVLREIKTSVSENSMFDGLDSQAIRAKYECSMFEYLIDKAEALCRQDPSHERYIQLNVQYRMPPVVGTIVSKNFYNGCLLNAELPTSHFMQNFPNIGGKNLVWVDLSKSGTWEKRSASRSIYRQCEADTIIKYIKDIVSSPEWYAPNYEEFKIGVITFYSRQKALIQETLLRELGTDFSSRIEIGTVDSFQGKEFDVVFLSLVRFNDRDEVGFLSSKNRMCVALSRCTKCLVIVGSSRILKYKNAEEKIPALADMYMACKNRKDGVCELRTE